MAFIYTKHPKLASHRKYGWKRQLPDHRDWKFAKIFGPPPVQLPTAVDLRSTNFMPNVYDQGQLGSCTANAICGAVEFEQRKQGLADFMPSRLFVYYNERDMEGSVGEDNGALIRDGIKSVATLGVCEESWWPYDISKFALKPPVTCYTRAMVHKTLQYISLDNTKVDELKACLAAGYPIVFGFSVYEGFESQEVATTGILNMPGRREEMVGGHAVVAVGYDDALQRFYVRNSWGAWGMNNSGYFSMPYSYITSSDLADDFWAIKLVADPLVSCGTPQC